MSWEPVAEGLSRIPVAGGHLYRLLAVDSRGLAGCALVLVPAAVPAPAAPAPAPARKR